MIKDPFLQDQGKEFYDRLAVKFEEQADEMSGNLIIFERVQGVLYLCAYDMHSGVVYEVQQHPLEVLDDIKYYQTIVFEFISALQLKTTKVIHFMNFAEYINIYKQAERQIFEKGNFVTLEKQLLDKLYNLKNKLFIHSNHHHKPEFGEFHIFRLPIGSGFHKLNRSLMKKLTDPELYNRQVIEECINNMNRHYQFTMDFGTIEAKVIESNVHQTIRYKNMTPITSTTVIYNITKIKFLKADDLILILKGTIYNKDKVTPSIKPSKEYYKDALTSQLKIFKLNRNKHFPLYEKNGRKCKVCTKNSEGKVRKSNYKCLACSQSFNFNIFLCCDPCFKIFHRDPLIYMDRTHKKKEKKTIKNKNREESDEEE